MIPLIPLLSKVPFIGTIISFVSNKTRLVIEYLLIALTVTMAGALLTLWLQKRNQDKVIADIQSTVVSLELAKQLQDTQITTLKDLRLRDSQSLEGLINDYKSLAQTDTAVRMRLKKLEQTNEAVRNYLDTPIPDAYRCVLNDTCKDGDSDSGGAAQASSKPSSALRKTN